MKLLSLEIGEQFRSLHTGFKINFHQLTDKGVESMTQFQPFCFAGLNGSGKSNVLECLAAIFYHLEMCVAKYRPDNFEKHFSRGKSTPNAFRLEYLINPDTIDSNNFNFETAVKVTIVKAIEKEPEMYVQEKSDVGFSKNITRVSMQAPRGEIKRSVAKIYLPDLVVGYSSGENEILSLPFIKNRLIHFDEYKENVKKGIPFDEAETSLIYIDEEMSQAVLLACILFEDPDTTLKPLQDELGIVGIRSFRMNLNLKILSLDDKSSATAPILIQLKEKLDILKSIASCWYDSKEKNQIWLDFYVDNNTKSAFKEHFKTSFNLFRLFQILYELNLNLISEESKKEVYTSRGYYTDGKLATAGPEDRVFHFLDYMILKTDDGAQIPQERLLRELSDGEHQFLHTMGICLMLKDRRTLLLLDEPETHFNPSWRAKFIKVLNDSLKAGGTNHFLKDIILTSHSPFIISDCLPNNVIFFKRNKETHKIEAKTAREMDFNTYGTSVEIILDELFEYSQSIGDWANEKLNEINFDDLKTDSDVEKVKQELRILGESIEKDLVLAKLNKLKGN